MAEQAKKDEAMLADANRKEGSDDENSEELSSDDEAARQNQFTFDSAIDIGSHFINVLPEGELVFQVVQDGSYWTELEI